MVGLVNVGCCYMKLTGSGVNQEVGKEEGGEGGQGEGGRVKEEGEVKEEEERERGRVEGGERVEEGEVKEERERVEEEERESERVGGEEGVEEGGGRVKEEEGEGVEKDPEGVEEGGERVKEEGAEGYPMSQFLRRQCVHQLSYAAKELACHSIATYRDRLLGEVITAGISTCIHHFLSTTGNFQHLKVHCHRAAVETVLRKVWLGLSQVMYHVTVTKS